MVLQFERIADVAQWAQEQTNVNVVGEHGRLLVVSNNSEKVVFGWYNWAANKDDNDTKVLHQLDPNVNVIQAAVDQDGTCLAYVTHDLKKNDEAYEAHVVSLSEEIQLSDLCVRSTKLLQVEFCRKKAVKGNLGCQLLVFGANIGIDLYDCEFDEQRRTFRFVKAESLTEEFLWTQWSPKHQCLFYLRFRSNHMNHHDYNVDYEGPRLMLTCFQFHDDVHHETVLNLPLDVSEAITSSLCSCMEEFEFDPIRHIISACMFHLEVLIDPCGVVYVCYQFVTTDDKHEQLFTRRDEPEETTLKLHYSLVMLYHGGCFSCEVNDLPRRYEKSKICFTFLSDNHVLAYIPGLFVHLLDVGLEHEVYSGTHILLPVDGSMPLVKSTLPDGHVVAHDLQIFRPVVRIESLLRHLNRTQHTSTRRAIVHYVLIHTKHDAAVLKLLLQTLLEFPDRLDLVNLFQEFLTGHTYSTCKKDVKKEFLELFPVTLGEALGRQIEQGPNNEQIQLTFHGIASTDTILLTPSQRLKLASNDIWLKIWNRHLLEACRKVVRFSHLVLKERLILAMETSLQTKLRFRPLPDDGKKRGFRGPFTEPLLDDRTSTFRDVNYSGTSEHEDDVALPFSEKSDYNCNQLEQILSMNLQEMSTHILKYHSDDLPFVVHKTAVEYVSAQMQSSRLLCSLLCGFEMELGGVHFEPWTNLPKSKMCRLFGLMEKFQIACSEIASPFPRGFLPFFCILGFKCLDFRMFFQYVDRGGLQLLPEVTDYIMKESDDEDMVASKLEMLLRLPRSGAWNLIESWDHPKSIAIQARERSKLMHSLPDTLENS